MATQRISNLHNYNQPAQSGGNGAGFGPLIQLPAGTYQCTLGLDAGPGASIKLQKSDGTVLAQGPGGHRPLTFASAVSVQFVVTASNLALVRSSGGTIMLSDGLHWSE